MNDRIKKLKEQSLQAGNRICPERARLLTEFYKSPAAQGISIPKQRALAFKYLMEHKTLCVNPGELIVGERGTAPKATPTYPEICIHSLEDLETLNTREKIPFTVDEETRELYKNEIIPYWKGKSLRERIFNELPGEWKEAYKAGIFTEFLEQRAPGHTVLGDKIYKKGFLDIIKEIREHLETLDYYNDPEAFDKKEELEAMAIAAEALILYAHRYAEKLKELAAAETDATRKAELEKMAEICRHVPAHSPRTFHEALQYYWFVHLGVITEFNNWDSFNPGRLDQHLYPFFYKSFSGVQAPRRGEPIEVVRCVDKTGDGENIPSLIGRPCHGPFQKSPLAAGGINSTVLAITEEGARELLQAFWVKFNNQPAPPKVGVTAKESNTYTDFCLINVGGVKADGSDAVNELSYLILDVVEEMRLLQPSSMVQVSKKNPDRFLKRALKIVRTGFGQPSIFNTDAIVQELVRQGKTLEDARNGGASGCVESGAFGVECYILTGYFNLAKILEITLHNGTDPLTGKEIGPKTGNFQDFDSYEQLMAAYRKQLEHFINIKIKGNNIISRVYAKYMPAPFLSLLIDDCIEKGKDYNNGGARCNTRYIQGVGLGSTTDALTALKYHVYDHKKVSPAEMLAALQADFNGYENLRTELVHQTPKYGNDNDYADDIMREIFEIFYRAVEGRPAGAYGVHHILLLPTTSHVYFGSVIGALPDGRKAGTPLSEGISPVQGADRNGPTSVIKSAAKLDHIRTGGTLLNQKFTPQVLKDETGLTKLLHLIRSYFKTDGHHMQFNVVDAETLRRAQENPEEYRGLIVRVAGYSDYFVDLTEDLQNEIIRRTEHDSF